MLVHLGDKLQSGYGVPLRGRRSGSTLPGVRTALLTLTFRESDLMQRPVDLLDAIPAHKRTKCGSELLVDH
jgi:hypothetical protein